MSDIASVRKVTPAPGAEMVRVPRPRLEPEQVRVRVRAASICGTDRHVYDWDAWARQRVAPPLTFGHECCGDVVEVGSGVRSVEPGDFVSLETHLPCLACRPCRTGSMHVCRDLKILGVDTDGAFAEEIVVPAICAWRNPPDMDARVAAIQEPFGNAVYCVDEARVAGRTVLVLGDGPIACFATAIARAMGAHSVTVSGIVPARLEIARVMGATTVLDARDTDPVEAVRASTDGEGVDVVLEMAGVAATVRQGLDALRKGGTFIAFGIPTGDLAVDYTNGIVFKEATIRGINGRRMFSTWYQTQALLTSGRVDPRPVLTHSFPLSEFRRAFDTLAEPGSAAGKITLVP